MHYMGGKIATGSKDCSVVESALAADGRITMVHSFQQQHEGAVKSARWGRPGLLATCGNDG